MADTSDKVSKKALNDFLSEAQEYADQHEWGDSAERLGRDPCTRQVISSSGDPHWSHSPVSKAS